MIIGKFSISNLNQIVITGKFSISNLYQIVGTGKFYYKPCCNEHQIVLTGLNKYSNLYSMKCCRCGTDVSLPLVPWYKMSSNMLVRKGEGWKCEFKHPIQASGRNGQYQTVKLQCVKMLISCQFCTFSQKCFVRACLARHGYKNLH